MRQKYNFYVLFVCCVFFFFSCAEKYYTQRYLNHLTYEKERKKEEREEAKKAKKEVKDAVSKERAAYLQLKKEKKQEQKRKRERRKQERQPKENSKKSDTTKQKKLVADSSKIEKPSQEEAKKPTKKPQEKKFVISKQAIKDIIKQSAQEEAIWDASGNVRLIGSTFNQMNNMNLNADTVIYNVNTGIMTAMPRQDSNGQLIKKIDFNQGDKNFRLEQVTFNPKTNKAILHDVQTKEGDLYIHSEKVKRVSDSMYFGSKSIFSTCNYSDPHFDFRTNKYKIVQNRVIVTGSLYAHFEGVPLPPRIPILPFAILPMPKERNSGILIPEIINDGPRGFGLQNGGYYFVLSPYADLRVMGSYFALGDYNLTLSSLYTKKYLLKNNTYADFQFSRNGSPGDADFSENFGYKLRWSFKLDPKVNPSINVQASLNFISNSQYNRNATQLSARERLNNTFSSSVSFTKRWKRGPVQQLSVSGTHSQNTTSKKIDLKLPSINLQTRQYNPIDLIKGGEGASTGKWYNKLRVSYNLSFRNKASVTETNFNLFHILDTSKWSASHNFPITLALPQLGVVNVNPSITYSQTWRDRQTERFWQSETLELDTLIRKGIFAEHSLSLGLNFNLKDLIGMIQFRGKRVKAIRHIIRLSGGISYTPDLKTNNSFYTTQTDDAGTIETLNYYTGGRYNKQETANLSFSIKNVIQAKWNTRRVKGDTTSKPQEKKADLITLGISGSYNLIADSFNLSSFAINYATNISKKISISGQMTIDPYYYSIQGRKTSMYVWQPEVAELRRTATSGYVGVGYISNFTSSLSLSFSGKKKGENSSKKSPAEITQQQLPYENTERYQILNETRETIRRNPGAFINFNIPWSLRIGLTAGYRRSFNKTIQLFEDKYTSTIRLDGSISLTKKWQLTYGGAVNINPFEFSRFEFGLTRDLHCWTLSIRVVPIGPYKQFGFTLQPKSPILRDLKVEPKHFFQ